MTGFHEWNHGLDHNFTGTEVEANYQSISDNISDLAQKYSIDLLPTSERWIELRGTGNEWKKLNQSKLINSDKTLNKNYVYTLSDDQLMSELSEINGYGRSYANVYNAATPEDKKRIANLMRKMILLPVLGGVTYTQFNKIGGKLKLIPRKK